jgi:hypothetical protein
MKTHALQFPVFVEDLDRAIDPGTSQAISTLLPGVKARMDMASGDYILLDASSLTASSMTASPMMVSSMTASSMTAAVPITRTERLVVLVPEKELDENELARRIWGMAAPGALEVLLLSMYNEPGTEAYLRLRLVTMASLIREERVQVGISLLTAKNWIEAVRQVWQPGDLLVCLQGLRDSGWLKQGPDLAKQLSDSLALPVYAMSGFRFAPSLRQLRKQKEWIAWMGFLGTLAVCSWIQVQINRAVTGNLWTVFMVLSVLVEISILWMINERTQ